MNNELDINSKAERERKQLQFLIDNKRVSEKEAEHMRELIKISLEEQAKRDSQK